MDHQTMEQISSPAKFPHRQVLKTMDNRIDPHIRPKTMLTPETKRTKIAQPTPQPLRYPTNVPIPSRRVIKGLYDASLEEGRTSGVTNATALTNGGEYNNQQYLNPAGLLSFEQILLPAVGLEEEKALKKVQSKVQRDIPEYKFVIENCRKLVRKSLRNAILEVQSSRTIRQNHQRERREQQALEKAKAKENRMRERKEERARKEREEENQKRLALIEKKRRLARESPRNQELWKEIVFLTSSVAQLEREERMWTQIEKDIVRVKGETQCEEPESDSSENELSAPSLAIVQAPKNPLQIETEEKVKDIVLASARIQKGLGLVLKLLEESEKVRQNLYEKYKKDHAYQGYQGINNPKGMIHFLSQSQDDYV